MTRFAPLAAVLALLGACNEPPGAPTVGIEPAEPTTSDALSAVILEDAVDPNKNDSVSYSYSWTLDGAVVDDLDGPEVPADRTQRGDTWAVTVTPADDKLAGQAATASITILNSAPSATVAIEPEAPLSSDDLILDVQTDDADGDTVNAQISWKVDGTDARISSERVPADRTTRGQVWEVTVVPKDARTEGEAVSASVQIANLPPEIESVRIRPELAYEESLLEVVIDASDYDGDDLTYSATWSVNGAAITEVTALELDGTYFDRDDVVSVEIVANDGLADSEPVASGEVTILNTPPSLDSVSITPSEAREGDTLTCTPTGFSDVDGDPEGYEYEWRIDGTVVSTATTLGSDQFGKGDRVSCTVTPVDGREAGLPVSARPIVIQNTPPQVTSITIGPSAPETGTTMTSTVTGASDVDDDAVRLDIDWYVDGRKVASGASLAGTAYVKSQDIYAEVTPYDGTDYGTKVKSNTVTSVNAPPSFTSWVLSPTTAYTDSVVAVTLGTTDPDFDTVTVDYDWKLNGSTYGTSSTTSIPASAIERGDIITVTTTPNDGTVDGTARSGRVDVVNKPPTTPVITLTPSDPELDDDLLCTIVTGSTDADSDPVTTTMTWYKDGVEWTGSTSTTTRKGDTIDGSTTADGDEWECRVTASDGYDTVTASEEVIVADRDGQVYTVSGDWIDVRYEKCGSGRTCSATQAKAACSAVGMKVVSHASNGTSSTYDLGATTSCNWSISYFKVDEAKSSSDCLVGISNLDWSSCCGTTRWHGNTVSFGSPGKVFGFVNSSNSGYVSTYSNSSGSTWGCSSLGTSASSSSSCSTLWVACTDE